MGAWGLGAFENDDAMDWAIAFQHAPSEQAVRDALQAVIGVEDYIERDPGSHALAAAEVVAATNGRPCRDIPPLLRDWAVPNGKIATSELVALALAAVERVTVAESSEVAELWADSPEAAAWAVRMDDLRQRLR
ncbi:MAG TPA: DUF4259 domain-containing protein [Xanthobacteraceae bacterium]|nr:DUF4259 domain-containing protein [Xanthobacteraceae bacterium]